ncbi:MAG: 2-oxoglutarate dehydrogenase E1 component [Bacteroidia bacterium]|nr:2-oxoglutarate dehydrogenase E1 component [Bacteroidia bacterium]MCF8426936.1 2-oxoglutarate dehydrogenase E1 component [Bacteroidia bacterium]MCF8446822.1 2-oxoglutarate dehydrogenase E1 component [Bacteroidia bacterium]
MDSYSYISNADVSAIDQLHQQYLQNPDSVDFGWKKFFEGFDFGFNQNIGSSKGTAVSEDALKEINVLNLIHGYRQRGHLFTNTNPVRERRQYEPSLEIERFGLQKADLEKSFNAGTEIGLGSAKLKDIVAHLKETYCQSIGAEYMFVRQPQKLDWLKKKMEGTKNTPNLNIEEKRHILSKLNQATIFENFLHTKFVGQKRFSLEGLETLIPALDFVINYGAELGVEEFVMGMAHRGRLNVLANILNKTYDEIFKEFEGKSAEDDGIFEGDVKYHMGFSSQIKTRTGKKVNLSLSPNPSHLEAVNPVVKGITRAKLEYKHKHDIDKVAPILIHGDASVAGQGIVYEVLQMAGLSAYSVGGCIHIVTNNQIGFTTNYTDARTSTYCTDIAKTTLSPVFHVNADDVEAVIFTVKLAMEYRQEFNSDVFIDLLGYRKYGHNEGDEPRFTQPVLYKAIASHPNPRELYNQKLLASGKVEAELAKEMEKDFRGMLQEKLEASKTAKVAKVKNFVKDIWDGFRPANQNDFVKSPDTSVDGKLFVELAELLTNIPKDFNAFSKIEKLMKDRKNMIAQDKYDWAMGELMAYATLSKEGKNIRMTGQDCERGTFSHRHAIIKPEDSDKGYNTFDSLGKHKKGNVYFHNSLLSEYAVLGFEYGYSMVTPNDLTIWEAQFGDFANGAQIIIDQYIASASTKWKTFSGLTLLLPHGYEGQGPEHSSARIERFLQLSANWNMQVCNITTPANYFHALRRQLARKDHRLPLVVMTPKSLLRHPACVSKLEDFTTGGFQEVIDDSTIEAKNVKRVLLCSGKIYYELLERQQSEKVNNIAIVRLEQLYPMPETQLTAIYNKYEGAEFCWVQEEPKNMGAWLNLLRWDSNLKLKRISRESSASPATGYSKVHATEQLAIIDRAFSL